MSQNVNELNAMLLKNDFHFTIKGHVWLWAAESCIEDNGLYDETTILYFFLIIESITYQVMMMAKAGKLRIKRISAAMPMKYKQNLFSFQLFNLNFSENIGISEIKRYDDRKTSNNMII